MDLGDTVVNERLQAVPLALDSKRALTRLELGHRKQHVFDQGEDTIAFDLLGGGYRLANLFQDCVARVE